MNYLSNIQNGGDHMSSQMIKMGMKPSSTCVLSQPVDSSSNQLNSKHFGFTILKIKKKLLIIKIFKICHTGTFKKNY